MIVATDLSRSDERILHEAIYRHVVHLAQLDYDTADTKAAAQMAADLFPQIGYPVPAWVSDLI